MGYLKIFKVMVTSFTISCMCTVTDIIHLFNYPCLQRKEKLIQAKERREGFPEEVAFVLTCEGWVGQAEVGEGHFCQEAEHSQERGRRKLRVNYGGMFRGRGQEDRPGLSYGGLECQARENSGWILWAVGSHRK